MRRSREVTPPQLGVTVGAWLRAWNPLPPSNDKMPFPWYQWRQNTELALSFQMDSDKGEHPLPLLTESYSMIPRGEGWWEESM